MKPLFSTFCAAAMTVAQPTFADQSVDILGTRDCQMVSEGFSGTSQFTFFSDGTGFNNWDLTWESIQRVTDSEITWHIKDGVLFHNHSHSTRRKYITGGIDRTDSLITKLTWKAPRHDHGDPATIVALTRDTLELVATEGTRNETCKRFLGS